MSKAAQEAAQEFAEIPGLRVAYAHRQAAQERHDLIVRRVAEAEEKVGSETNMRAMLLRMAAAGKEVLPAQLRGVDDKIRDAEASVTLTTAALPSAKSELGEAERAVQSITTPILVAAHDRVRAEVKIAEAAAEAARVAVEVAFQRANMQQLPLDVADPIMKHFEWHKSVVA